MSIVSDEDLALIVEQGAPDEPKPEYVVVGTGGSITLSETGRNFYTLALAFYGLPVQPLQHVRDLDGVRAITLRIRQIKLLFEQDIAERERRGGQIPLRARAIVDAFQRGDRNGVNAALDYRLSGDNVIPALFRRRTQH